MNLSDKLRFLHCSFQLFSDPTLENLKRWFQGGEVAAYEHTALIKLHYSIADALDDCISKLERTNTGQSTYTRRASFETSINAPEIRQARDELAGLQGIVKPLEQIIAEAIKVKKDVGSGAISFGALSFDDDEFVPIDSKDSL